MIAPPLEETATTILDEHRGAGRLVAVDHVNTFVRDHGDGPPVLLLHGLPSSSFLYRKVLGELTRRGCRPIAFDFPGLGLTDRPPTFDYSIRNLGAFTAATADALALDSFHLVVHDAGGPIGFEFLTEAPGRVRSLTILNTCVAVDRPPFPAELYAHLALRGLAPKLPNRPIFRTIMRTAGVRDQTAVSRAEWDVWYELIRRVDGGEAYLKIMAGADRSAAKQRQYERVVDSTATPYPVQLLWAAGDPIFPLRTEGFRVANAANVPAIITVPGRHYFPEERAPVIASVVADLVHRIEGTDPPRPP